MKVLLTLVFACFLFSCAPQSVVQADLVNATLVEVQTRQRYEKGKQKMLTWKTDNNLTIVTFAHKDEHYPLGTRMKVMVPR